MEYIKNASVSKISYRLRLNSNQSQINLKLVPACYFNLSTFRNVKFKISIKDHNHFKNF